MPMGSVKAGRPLLGDPGATAAALRYPSCYSSHGLGLLSGSPESRLDSSGNSCPAFGRLIASGYTRSAGVLRRRSE
jgi:hypothetical protein